MAKPLNTTKTAEEICQADDRNRHAERRRYQNAVQAQLVFFVDRRCPGNNDHRNEQTIRIAN